jgi:N-acetylmuramoyl-L-alanine amidase
MAAERRRIRIETRPPAGEAAPAKLPTTPETGSRVDVSFRPRSARPRPLRKRTNRGKVPFAFLVAAVGIAVVIAGIAWALIGTHRSATTAASKTAVAAEQRGQKSSSLETSAPASAQPSALAGGEVTPSASTKSASTSTKSSTSSSNSGATSGGSSSLGSGASLANTVVVIDAGHEATDDPGVEPIGPGSKVTAPKATAGASGSYAPHAESEIDLQVALKLRRELQARGVKVVMVRTSQNVTVSNSQRAAVANKAHATLFIRLHCNAAPNTSKHGFSTIAPPKNPWTKPIVSASAKARTYVSAAALKATGAANSGTASQADLSGFNWSKVPTIVMEMGFVSNSADDKSLTTASYQHKLAVGIASGVVQYLRAR